LIDVVSQNVKDWLEKNGYGYLVNIQNVGGGCINQGFRLITASGETFFLKSNKNIPGDMFQREAQGLTALQQPGVPRVPQPYLYGLDFLLMEDLSPTSPGGDYWIKFGNRLAVLHKVISDKFGFPHDNYIGSTPQLNSFLVDGFIFFGQQRLLFQARFARNRGLLSLGEVQMVNRLVGRLPDLIPKQPASLLHGDLWSGNAISDKNGSPAIIDPAAHYGWAEAELAMTSLFGAFPDSFYQAYQDERPLDKGFRKRFPIYNLYHLLNHLNLFGRGYYGQVISILNRFA
jgi:protein-ribulosamine 3-kinase